MKSPQYSSISCNSMSSRVGDDTTKGLHRAVTLTAVRGIWLALAKKLHADQSQ
jgi:hypothetical protein